MSIENVRGAIGVVQASVRATHKLVNSLTDVQQITADQRDMVQAHLEIVEAAIEDLQAALDEED